MLRLSLSFPRNGTVSFLASASWEPRTGGVRGTVSSEGSEECDICHVSCPTEEACSPRGHGPREERREAVRGIRTSLKHMRAGSHTEPLKVGMASVVGVSLVTGNQPLCHTQDDANEVAQSCLLPTPTVEHGAWPGKKQPWDWKVGHQGEEGAGDWAMNTPEPELGAHGLANTLMCWEGCVPREGACTAPLSLPTPTSSTTPGSVPLFPLAAAEMYFCKKPLIIKCLLTLPHYSKFSNLKRRVMGTPKL